MRFLPHPGARRGLSARNARVLRGALAVTALFPVWAGPAVGQAPTVNGGAAPAEGRTPPLPPGPSFGPLTTEEAGPLQRVSFTHTVEGADILPRGTFQAEVWLGYSNIFEQDSTANHELYIDMERLAKNVGVRWGVTQRLELGGRLSFESTGGGILDGFLTAWHRKLGVGNGNRDLYLEGVYDQRLRVGKVDVPLPDGPRAMALEDAHLFAKWQAWESADGRRLVSFRGVARLPAQTQVGAGRTSDVSLMALARASWTRWHLHGTVGGATVRAARAWDGLMRKHAVFVDVAAERNLAPWVSGVVQLSAASPRLQGLGDPELDGWPVNLVFGATGRMGEGWRWDVSFQEDLLPDSPAVDFTLGIGVRRRW